MNLGKGALTRFAIAAIVGGVLAACTEAPGVSEVDFSGVYAPPIFVGTPPVTEPDVYPFTAEAARAFDAFDPVVANPRRIDDCVAETMPGILWSASPMEIVQESERIVFHYERGNTLRSIPMATSTPPPSQPSSELGYSVARWSGNDLIIETTHMMSGSIRNNTGYPLSPGARVTERYWRELGTDDLRLELLVDDSANYTQTFALGREWVWAPDEEVLAYECVSLGPMDSEPDIDELARMLEEL